MKKKERTYFYSFIISYYIKIANFKILQNFNDLNLFLEKFYFLLSYVSQL